MVFPKRVHNFGGRAKIGVNLPPANKSPCKQESQITWKRCEIEKKILITSDRKLRLDFHKTCFSWVRGNGYHGNASLDTNSAQYVQFFRKQPGSQHAELFAVAPWSDLHEPNWNLSTFGNGETTPTSGLICCGLDVANDVISGVVIESAIQK